MKLLINIQYVIKAYKKLLTLPYKERVHPLQNAIYFDGMSSIRKGSQNRAEKNRPLSSSNHGDQGIKNNIKYISRNGLFSVLNGNGINFVLVELVLEFLTSLFVCGLSYTALKLARS